MNIIVSSTKQKSLNFLIVILRPFVESEATVSCRQEFCNLVIQGASTIGISSNLVVPQVRPLGVFQVYKVKLRNTVCGIFRVGNWSRSPLQCSSAQRHQCVGSWWGIDNHESSVPSFGISGMSHQSCPFVSLPPVLWISCRLMSPSADFYLWLILTPLARMPLPCSRLWAMPPSSWLISN